MKAIEQFTIECTEKQIKENPLYLIETMKLEDEKYLEYVIVVANEFNPCIESDFVQQSDNPEDVIENLSIVPSYAPHVFKKRYNLGKLKPPFTINEYLKNEKIQSVLSKFQLDIEKFWYLMLYIYDNSYDLCKTGIEIEQDKSIDLLIGLLDKYPDKKITITIGRGKESIELKDTVSNLSRYIDWNTLLIDLDHKKLMSGKLYTKGLANTIWAYDFTRKLLYFLEGKQIDNKASYKLIALILNFTELQIDYKSDNIKILLYKYKDYKFNSHNNWY